MKFLSVKSANQCLGPHSRAKGFAEGLAEARIHLEIWAKPLGVRPLHHEKDQGLISFLHDFLELAHMPGTPGVGASGKRARPSRTRVTDFNSIQMRLEPKERRKSTRPSPKRGSTWRISAPKSSGIHPSARMRGKARLGRVESKETKKEPSFAPTAVNFVLRSECAGRRRIGLPGESTSKSLPGLGRWASSSFPFTRTQIENRLGRERNSPQISFSLTEGSLRGLGLCARRSGPRKPRPNIP